MGVMIHYRGQLANRDAVFQLVDELKDIANSMDWQYETLDEDWLKPPTAKLETAGGPGIFIAGSCSLKGIQIRPHERCDPIWLFFNAQGILTSPFRVALDAEEGYPVYQPWIFTKTQFAGVPTHITVIRLLRYLKQKYLPDLEVNDEGGYWETENEELLRQRFGMIELAIEQFDQSVTKVQFSVEDTTETIVRKIEDAFRRDHPTTGSE